MKVELVPVEVGLAVLFDDEFVNRFGLSADTAFEISVVNESIVLKPADPKLTFDGLVFDRLAGNQFVARIA
jgi:hypothetical protein